MDAVQLAALLSLVALAASIVSVELGVTVALVELSLGVVVGSAFDLPSQEWLDFIAAFASIVLTFLAGAAGDSRRLLRSRSDSRRRALARTDAKEERRVERRVAAVQAEEYV